MPRICTEGRGLSTRRHSPLNEGRAGVTSCLAPQLLLIGKHPAAEKVDAGPRSQKDAPHLLTVGVPNEIQLAGARQRRSVIDVYGDRTRAVRIHREGSLQRLVKEISRYARCLSAA